MSRYDDSPKTIANARVTGHEGLVDIDIVNDRFTAVRPAANSGATNVIDVDGSFVTAGLNDGHSHWIWGAKMLDWVDLAGLRTLDEVRQALAKRRQELGPDAWLLARGTEYTPFLPHGGPHRNHIDDVTGPGPAYLMFFDIHGALANSEAIERSRLRAAADPVAGSVERDDNGPTGFLIEFEAMKLVEDHVPAQTEAERHSLAIQTLETMSRHGYTSAHMMNGRVGELDLIRSLDEAGSLPLDLEVCWDLTPELDAQDALAGIERLGLHGEHWRVGGVKFWLDGVIDSGSAWLCHTDHHGGNDRPLWMPPERYRELAKAYSEAGFRIATHAIGDAAVTYALETYLECTGPARHRVEHLELTNDRNLELLSEQPEVAASIQPPAMAFVSALRDDTWSDRVPTDQWERAWAMRDIRNAGTRIVMGTDWPVLPLDPRLAFYWAMERRPLGTGPDQAIGRADQALTASEVLDGFTTEPAWVLNRSDVGVISPGARADLAVWDRDLLNTSAADLLNTNCLATIAQGRIVHDTISD